jgi:2'-5' RNA ligase
MTAGDDHYALWLLLPEPVETRLRGLIHALAQRHATPVFEPHITLLSGLAGAEAALGERSGALARRLPPMEIELGALAHTPAYFRCLFVRLAESAPLKAAHRAACELFGVAEKEDFLPHASLVYGELDCATKERILEELGRRLDLRGTVTRIALIDYRGPPPAWRRVGTFALSGTTASA